jgi:hypothetical protein
VSESKARLAVTFDLNLTQLPNLEIPNSQVEVSVEARVEARVGIESGMFETPYCNLSLFLSYPIHIPVSTYCYRQPLENPVPRCPKLLYCDSMGAVQVAMGLVST